MADQTTVDPTAGGPAPESQANPQESTARETFLETMGLTAHGEADHPSDDSGAKPGDQKTDPDHPDKTEETTSPDGPGDKSDERKERLLANKYKTPEALEHGYSNLFGQHEKVKGELETSRGELKQLKAELEQLKAGKTTLAPETTSTAKKTDGAVNILDDQVVKEAFETLAMIVGGDGAQALSKIIEHVNNQVSERVSQSHKVAEETSEKLDQLEAKERLEEFKRTHPDAEHFTDEMKAIYAEAAEKGTDDVSWWDELMYNAARGRSITKIIDESIPRRLTEILEKLPAHLQSQIKTALNRDSSVAASLALGTSTAGRTSEPSNKTKTKREEFLAKHGLEPYKTR